MAVVIDDVVTFQGLPARVEVAPDVVLRRFTTADIPALVEAVNSSIDALRPWMPWAQQPVTVEAQLEWFRGSEHMWLTGTGFNYSVVSAADEILGGAGFHVRNGPGVLEIGYWLVTAHERRGVMTRVAQALTDVAAGVEGVDRVEIHCDAANVRSSAIPRRLGYELVEIREIEPEAPACTGRLEIWSRPVGAGLRATS